MEIRKYNSPKAALEIELPVRDGPRKSPRLVAAGEAPAGEIIVIERRTLLRECLSRALRPLSGQRVLSFPSVGDWLDVSKDVSASVVILSVGKSSIEEIQSEMGLLTQRPECPPLVIFSDAEAPGEIVTALHKGARGFIPTSISLGVATKSGPFGQHERPGMNRESEVPISHP